MRESTYFFSGVANSDSRFLIGVSGKVMHDQQSNYDL